jgi:serine/threonine-protein kinase
MIAAAAAATHGTIDLISAALSGLPNPQDPVLMGAAALISLSMALAARKEGIRRSTMMDLAFTYQVLFCGIISLAEAINTRQVGDSVWGVSWVCVAMVVFPAALPYRRFPMILAAVMSALSGPVMYVIASPIQQKPMNLSDALSMYIPNFITLGIAIATILYVSTWARRLERARQMGSYRLVSQIGVGGMGEVWKAEHESLARPAAIKLIHTGQHGTNPRGANLESRFYREAQATAALTSAHTVTVYDYGTTRDGNQYYVMELLEGITLQDAVSRYGPMLSERVTHMLIQICHSLAEAHESRLIHRDIKPANVFLCQKGKEYDFVKVLDFGLVKPREDQHTQLTLGSEVLGTPAYAAPESVKGNTYDERSDIYSLGCVAYFLLSGQALFNSDNPIDLIFKHVNEEPVPIKERAALPVHAGLSSLVMRCIEKDPVARPQHCDELLKALEEIATDIPWTRQSARDWWQRYIPPRTQSIEAETREW